MSVNSFPNKPRAERLDGRLFLTEENLDRGTLTLLAAARKIEVQLRRSISDAGLSATEVAVLTEICLEPGIDVSSLRDRVGGTTPTIARILAGLEKQELIDRQKAEGDARRRALRLTRQGMGLIDHALAAIRKDMTQVYRQSGEPSVTGAIELLQTIISIHEEQPKS